ncbi:hypothetical protein DSO57_1039025, partial [Entomophthora muscae]
KTTLSKTGLSLYYSIGMVTVGIFTADMDAVAVVLLTSVLFKLCLDAPGSVWKLAGLGSHLTVPHPNWLEYGGGLGPQVLRRPLPRTPP